ncbi:UDP-N-acetylmuramoyl-tripeptide--D-alanyl-D-alanine ligase [Alloscardovia criceti]|uniref:UDP-N-acetylmuramoyl-tripeptide--D-alanyl-D- alanine ligase n=1 Tax=Alloscardovia criceti TaxID=356828 RepID=UPI00037630DD|nr:UDP-N-acetylmuramoyl-tripeptide--D-alanyl-D-alanine ligase [Alloscardovia criceti]
MISTHLSEFLDAEIGQLYVNGQFVSAVSGDDDFVLTHVTSDSRQVRESSVFVAIAGEHVDGHSFVSKLSGLVVAVVDHAIEDAAVPQLVVMDTVKALGDIARLNIRKRKAFAARGMNEFTIIGITGSVGKTTTKDMLHAVLSRVAPTVAPQGSFNNDIGLPLTALEVNEKTHFFVAEMGASAIGEIAYLTTIAPPDISIVLKVGVAHLGGFGSVEGIRDAKSEIVRALSSSGVAILNADDDYVRTMVDMTKASSIIWFSRQNAEDFAKPKISSMASSVILRGTHTQVDELNRARFTVALPDGNSFDLRLGISGEHNVYNALAVLSVIYSLDIPEHIAAQILSQMTAISPHRMHIADVHHGEAAFTVIDDSFNANPDSMKAGLDALKAFRAQDAVQRIAVLGSMLELGPTEKEAHRSIGAYAMRKADVVVAVGLDSDSNLMDLAQNLADGAQAELKSVNASVGVDTRADANSDADSLETNTKRRVFVAHNADEADQIVASLARNNRSIVLLKGSHASGLSALASRWLGTN